MSNREQIEQEYKDIKDLKEEFDQEYQKAVKTRVLKRTKEIRKELEQRKDSYMEKFWMFEKKTKAQYEGTLKAYRKFGWLETLSSGKEGIKDEKGKEYPIPSYQEIRERLIKNQELYISKMLLFENPRLHLSSFALSPEKMKDDYSKQIGEHHERGELLGVDEKDLELTTSGENVYFDSTLKNLTYFPEWEEQGAVENTGMTKEEAIAQQEKWTKGWRVIIIEGTPQAPIGEKSIEIKKKIKVGEEIKTISRVQVRGNLKAHIQYQVLNKQGEEGFTPEDWLSYAMLHLEEENIALDDDKGIYYYCRLLGATASGVVPGADWNRGYRQASLGRSDPDSRGSGVGVRSAVRVL